MAYLIIGSIISLFIFVIKPILKANYFTDTIYDFKRNSWKYSIGIALVLFVTFAIYAYKNKKLNNSFLIYNLISVSLIALFGKPLIDGVLLYVNLKIQTEQFTKSYVVSRYDPNKEFYIHDNKGEFIRDKEQLNRIEALRIKKGLKSLYLLQGHDTLNVDYTKGLLDVKFLK